MATATMTQHPSLKGMTAVSKDSAAEKLGYIVWFSVPDEDAAVRKVRRLWQLVGLDPKPLPQDPKEIDAFKRAVRDEEARQTLPDGTVIETDVHDVLTSEAEVVYQVSRVVRDRENRVVEFPKALLVWYSKLTGDLGFKPLGEVKRSAVMPMMEAIQSRFEANAKTITGAKVRALVRNFIIDDDDARAGMTGLAGENMRGKAGGVYFVLARYEEQIESLAEFLAELYPNGRAYLYANPMADSATEREMIRRQHAANCIAETRRPSATPARCCAQTASAVCVTTCASTTS